MRVRSLRRDLQTTAEADVRVLLPFSPICKRQSIAWCTGRFSDGNRKRIRKGKTSRRWPKVPSSRFNYKWEIIVSTCPLLIFPWISGNDDHRLTKCFPFQFFFRNRNALGGRMRREGRWYIIDAYCGYFFLKRTGFSFHIVAFCFFVTCHWKRSLCINTQIENSSANYIRNGRKKKEKETVLLAVTTRDL